MAGYRNLAFEQVPQGASPMAPTAMGSIAALKTRTTHIICGNTLLDRVARCQYHGTRYLPIAQRGTQETHPPSSHAAPRLRAGTPRAPRRLPRSSVAVLCCGVARHNTLPCNGAALYRACRNHTHHSVSREPALARCLFRGWSQGRHIRTASGLLYAFVFF